MYGKDAALKPRLRRPRTFAHIAGAAIIHSRRGEKTNVIVNAILGILAAGVAIARFGPYAF